MGQTGVSSLKLLDELEILLAGYLGSTQVVEDDKNRNFFLFRNDDPTLKAFFPELDVVSRSSKIFPAFFFKQFDEFTV